MALTIIDNYDSFTFNLYQLLAEVTGEVPRVIRNDASWSELLSVPFDGLVLSPGPGRPDVDRDFGLCARVIQEINVPILGVCLGHQGIGHGFGARVVPAPEVMHGRPSMVRHEGDELFAGIPSVFEAIRYHSLIVHELPDELEAIAWSEEGLVMGLKHTQRPMWGVQFHPESIGTQWGRRLLENFAALATGPAPKAVTGLTATTPPQQQSGEPTHQVLSRRLKTWIEPEVAFVQCIGTKADAWWLDSNDTNQSGPRYSYMGFPCGPESEVASYDVETGALTVASTQGDAVYQERLCNWLIRRLNEDNFDCQDLPFDLCGGYVGFFGYEYKGACGGSRAHRSREPDGRFVRADRYLVFDHIQEETWVVAITRPENHSGASVWLDDLCCELSRLVPLQDMPQFKAHGPLKLSRPRAQYLADIDACFDELNRGESYEICLTTHLRGPAIPDALGYYRRLRQLNPAPYSAFIRLGETAVVCSSPERFIRIDENGHVEARPIKGTRPRGKTPAEDRSIAAELAASPKDRSENLMIVDLLRNDLGRVCSVGTVHVPELMVVEQYATVHQLVSSVRGQLSPGLSAVDCVESAFPGGSMTGAPKLRTMEIIDGLEGEARGIYSGALGYFSATGSADFNIVIRTAICGPDGVSIGVGGAIIALSEPNAEFDEILLKGAVLAQAMGAEIES